MVVDTSIFIQHLRSKDQSKSILSSLRADSVIYVSALTVFEIYSGANDERKIADAKRVLEDALILPLTTAAGELAGEIFRDLRRRGLLIESTDILIAATALFNDLPVKTLNVNHFSRIPGLVLV